MKFFRINKIICNSNFTKKIVDEEYNIDSVVLYPPVDVAKFKALKKENQIIYVGRFSQLTQSKRQDILIEAFKRFHDNGHIDWKLILAGGVEVGAGDFLTKLKEAAKTYPIKIIESPSFKDLKSLVGSSIFFWSAAGFGVDEHRNPKQVEHFGISLVEAMAAGCIPLVYTAGGHKEIVKNNYSGFLWQKEGELTQLTEKLLADNKKMRDLARQVRQESDKFSYARFEKGVLVQVTEARTGIMQAKNPKESAKANNMLTSALKTLFAVAESYPQLRANENFLKLQEEFSTTENKIAYARQFYNDEATGYNTSINSIPTNIIASTFNFKGEELFELEDLALELHHCFG